MLPIIPKITWFPFHHEDMRSWITPEFIQLNTTEIKSPYTFALHQHNEHEVIIVDRGRYQCLLNKTTLQLSSGGLLIVKPGDLHEDICLPPLRYFASRFRLQRKSLGNPPVALFRENVTAVQQTIRVDRRIMWPILNAIRREARKDDRISSQIQHALLLEFFWRMVRALPSERLSSVFNQCAADQYFLSQLSVLFRNRLNDKCSLRDMAHFMGMGQSSFSHECKRILGVPPVKACMKSKMDYARQYLLQAPMSIKEISAYLGFENPYHFSKTFKHYAGHPPSFFRG